MTRCAHSKIITTWLTLAAHGCSAYSAGSSTGADEKPDAGSHLAESPPEHAATPSPAPAPVRPKPTPVPVPETEPKAVTPAAPPRAEKPHENPVQETPVPSQPPAPIAPTTLRVAHSSGLDSYLTDSAGQPLYMFAGDVSNSAESACLDECALSWPPFDVAVSLPGVEIEPSEVSRFHRQDGLWQTTYKGHPLYYRASELDTREVTGDSVEGRWFVARDYLTFLASARTFTPLGGTATEDVFLTDGFGRTLYICLDDQPRTNDHEASTSCDAQCTVSRPIFQASETARTTLLPSMISAIELRELVRPDGQRQLTYRGWPLYYYSGDVAIGSSAGHNDRAWRAIDPISFGLAAESEH